MTGLRGKLAVLFVIGFGLICAFALSYLHHSLQHSFQAIEQQQAIEQVRQVGRNLDAELSDLNRATYEWSNKDDTYAFLLHRANNFTDRHITSAALKAAGVNFFALMDNAGNTVFSAAISLTTAENESNSSFDHTLANIKTRLQNSTAGNDKACGLDISTVGPMLICWHPVRQTDLTGAPAGTLVLGRLLNSALVNKIQNQSNLKFDLAPLTVPGSTSRTGIKNHVEPVDIKFNDNDPDSIHATLQNILGDQILNLHLNLSHSVSDVGAKFTQTGLVPLAVIIFAIGFLLYVSTNVLILQRLRKMGAELKAIWRNGRWAERLYTYRASDELAEIVHTVNRMLGLIRKQAISLETIAYTDSLTQIANKRCFEQRIVIEMSVHRRNQTPLSLIVFDIDFFKQYNDLYGHPAGDEILIELAKMLTEIACRPSDLTSRIADEQFALILPATDLEGATHVAETLARKLAERNIAHNNSPIANVLTLSIGVTTAGDEDLATLMHRIEMAHNQARQSGRNRICVLRADSKI